MESENILSQQLPVLNLQEQPLENFTHKSLNKFFLQKANDRYIEKDNYAINCPYNTSFKHFITFGSLIIENIIPDENNQYLLEN